MYRLFVAIDLPDTVKNSLRATCCGLPDARWVDLQQLHLTLRFIGEVDDDLFAGIRTSLGEIDAAPFSLTLEGVGCFPPKRPPRVMWVGMAANEALMSLAETVERVLVEKNGLPPESRRFTPHITIARFREANPARVAEYLAKNRSFQTETFPVDAFHLYSSTLTPKGAIHKREASYPLLRQEKTI